MGGQEIEFGEADLAAANVYDPALHEAPIVVGHPAGDAPAYGWVAGVAFSEDGLLATPAQVDRWIEACRYAARLCGGERPRPVPEVEKESLDSLRRGVYLRKALKKGAVVSRDDVYFAMPYCEGQLESGHWCEGIVCNGNLHQIGLGMFLYADEQDDFFPFAVFVPVGVVWNTYTRHDSTWDCMIAEHLSVSSNYRDEEEIYICPADIHPQPTYYTDNPAQKYRRRSYTCYTANSPGYPGPGSSAIGFHYDYGAFSPYGYRSKRVSEVTDPSNAYLACEKSRYISLYTYNVRGNIERSRTDGNWRPEDSPHSKDPWADFYTGENMLYADGRVTWLTR